MSSRALLRRSREARAWLLDAMVPLWCQAAITRDGSVIGGLDLNHRPPETAPPDPVAAARLAAALARVHALDPGDADIVAALDLMLADAPEGPDGETLLARASWLLAWALAHGQGALARNLLPAGLAGVVEAAHGQAVKLISGKAFRAAGLPTWFDACLALALAEPGQGHVGRASGLAASLVAFLQTSPDGLFVRPGDAIDTAEQFDWSWRLADHARAIGAAVPGEAGRLYAFGCSTLDDAGVAPDRVRSDGAAEDGTAMTLEAQAGALMAHLTRLRSAVDETTLQRAALSFDALMDNHLTPEGGWIGAYDSDGLPADRQIETRQADIITRAFTRLIDITAAW